MRTILLAVILIYVGLCALVFFRQRSMLYFPSVRSEAAMLDEARGLNLVRWFNASGVAIGWVTTDPASDFPVLLCHGNGGHALDGIKLLRTLRAAGISERVHILDYPGYGSRAGSPTQTSLVSAAVEALETLGRPTIMIGESLGSGVVSQAAKRRPDLVKGLLLLTPFDSVSNAAAFHYPWFPAALLVLDRFDSVAALREGTRPVAIVVAGADTTTPPAGGMRLFESLPEPKKLIVFPTAGHNDVEAMLSADQWHELWLFLKSSTTP